MDKKKLYKFRTQFPLSKYTDFSDIYIIENSALKLTLTTNQNNNLCYIHIHMLYAIYYIHTSFINIDTTV